MNTEYIGFTINGVHSSEFGVLRVSDGSRYNEDLLPEYTSKQTPIPGGDGYYDFGGYFSGRTTSIKIAFDGMTEEQKDAFSAALSPKKSLKFVFDEHPYKIYVGKVSNTISLTHIPFEEGPTGRIYKGEGTITFKFQPYAHCEEKDIRLYNDTGWNDAARLINLTDFDSYDVVTREIKLYNPGVKEADFKLYIKFTNEEIKLTQLSLGLERLQFKSSSEPFLKKGDDEGIVINTASEIIEGYKKVNGKYIRTGTIYNEYKTGGHFFKIPLSLEKGADALKLYLTTFGIIEVEEIEYNYLYF